MDTAYSDLVLEELRWARRRCSGGVGRASRRRAPGLSLTGGGRKRPGVTNPCRPSPPGAIEPRRWRSWRGAVMRRDPPPPRRRLIPPEALEEELREGERRL